VEPQHADVVKGNVYVDFGDFPPQDIVAGFITQEKQDSVFANLLRSMDWDRWKELVALLAKDGFATEDRKMAELLSYRPQQGRQQQNDVSLSAIKNNLVPPIKRLHRAGATLGKNIIQGLAAAQCSLGFCYDRGEGVAKDMEQAVNWYRKSAEQGYPNAQYSLGNCYKVGLGVAKDPVEAVKWYRKAAESGFAQAQFNLGVCCHNGEGLPADAVEAASWFGRAAKRGLVEAQCLLALGYAKGDGVAKDMGLAAKWFREAAEQGDAVSQRNLATFYLVGDVLAKDNVEAYKWLSLARAQGDDLAGPLLTSLAERMTPGQIAEAKRLAGGFRPRKSLEPGAFPLNQPAMH
jgi:TPR repeat protein